VTQGSLGDGGVLRRRGEPGPSYVDRSESGKCRFPKKGLSPLPPPPPPAPSPPPPPPPPPFPVFFLAVLPPFARTAAGSGASRSVVSAARLREEPAAAACTPARLPAAAAEVAELHSLRAVEGSAWPAVLIVAACRWRGLTLSPWQEQPKMSSTSPTNLT